MLNFTNLVIPDLTFRTILAVPVGLLGLVGNIFLILTFIRPHSELNSPRNYSLCVLAFADVLCCISELQYDLESVVISYHWPTSKRCLISRTYAIFAHNMESLMVWVIAVDRAMVVRWSLIYDVSVKISVVRYFLISLSVFYGFFGAVGAWITLDETRIMPICHTPEAEAGIAGALAPFRLMVHLFVVVTHCWTYCQPTDASDLTARRIQQSILIVALVYLSTALTPVVVLILSFVVGTSTENIFLLICWVTIIIRISFGANFYIFGLRSELFRSEYKKTWMWVRRGFKNNQISVPIVTNRDATRS